MSLILDASNFTEMPKRSTAFVWVFWGFFLLFFLCVFVFVFLCVCVFCLFVFVCVFFSFP